MIHLAPLLFLIRPALALNPNQQISQYGHSVWRLQDGVFPGTPHAITQTADGYIWVGGEGGLVRFDGARFVRWSPPESAKMVESVFSLLGTRDGSLWVGAANGFGRRNGDSFEFRQIGRVNALVEGAGGAVWMALSRITNEAHGPLCRAGHDTLQCFGAAQGIGFQNQGAEAMIGDLAGGLWIGTTKGLAHWNGSSATEYLPKAMERAQGSAGSWHWNGNRMGPCY